MKSAFDVACGFFLALGLVGIALAGVNVMLPDEPEPIEPNALLAYDAELGELVFQPVPSYSVSLEWRDGVLEVEYEGCTPSEGAQLFFEQVQWLVEQEVERRVQERCEKGGDD